MIYLDYSATTPVDKRVLEVFNKVCLEYPANANSLHDLGLMSKRVVDYSTSKIAKLLGVKNSEIIYTSGASESNNTVIKGVCNKYKNRGKHIISTYLEHSSIIEPLNYLREEGYEVDYVKIDDTGLVDLEDLRKLIREDTILVSICAVDSELGLVQPINEIGKILKNYPKCLFHVDCTQAIGKINIDFSNVDLASLSAHKFYGLKGIGLIIKKDNISFEPLIHGGISTTSFRSGTPCLPLIASLSKALELIIPNISDNYEYVNGLSKMVKDKLKTYDLVKINSTDNSMPYTINFSLMEIKPETFIRALSTRSIYISTKSACTASNAMSKAVYAVTKNKSLAYQSLRISLSYLTTKEEINTFLNAFDDCYRELILK